MYEYAFFKKKIWLWIIVNKVAMKFEYASLGRHIFMYLYRILTLRYMVSYV
jgi:hypothetical protein